MIISGLNQVQNVKESGPVAYSFSARPELDSPVYNKLEMKDIVVDPRWQKVILSYALSTR